MHVEIITPEGTLYASEASQVLVPGEKAPFAMRENHQAILSTLLEGRVRITTPEGSDVLMMISGNAIVEQHANRVSIMASRAELLP